MRFLIAGANLVTVKVSFLLCGEGVEGSNHIMQVWVDYPLKYFSSDHYGFLATYFTYLVNAQYQGYNNLLLMSCYKADKSIGERL